MNDNKKIRAPKIAMTTSMMKEGLEVFKTVMEYDDAKDDDMVAAIFFAMWNAYWLEVEAARRKKATVHPLIRPTASKLILPSSVS